LISANLAGPVPLTDRNPVAHRSALRQFYLGRLVFFEKLFSPEIFRNCFPAYAGALDTLSRLGYVCELLNSTSTVTQKTMIFETIEAQLKRLHREADAGPNQEIPGASACSIDFNQRDAAQLVQDYASQGFSVFVQNAANAQRFLGAATYQSGTLEEPLTQCTSLFED
jgi:hypothetical protein